LDELDDDQDDEELDKNQDIEMIREQISKMPQQSAQKEERPFSSQSIGIGEGNVFESSDDSDEQKDRVLELEDPIEEVKYIESPPKKGMLYYIT
jgi:hypothetical protein